MKKKNETSVPTPEAAHRRPSGASSREAQRPSPKRPSVRQLELFATDADGRLAPEAWEGESCPKPSVAPSRKKRSSEVQPSKKPVEAGTSKDSAAPSRKKRSSEVQPSKKPVEAGASKDSATSSRKKRSSEVQSPKKPVEAGTSKLSSQVQRSTAKAAVPMPAWMRYLLMLFISVAFSGAFYYFFIRPYAYRWKPCYGLKAYGICMPYGYQVHGIDISHHQGAIDWAHLRQTRQGPFPIQFIFLKASEGGDYSDPTFAAHFDSARSHGFIRGAYHFYNPKTDPVRQADFFIRSVKLEPGDLPPVLDIEKRGKDEAVLRRDLKIWLDRIEQHYRVKPILYTSYKFKTRYLNDSVFNSYPYWIAHYYVDSVKYRGEWKFWQHTDVGSLPGIEEQVDLNIFNGSIDELKQLLIPATEATNDSVSSPMLSKSGHRAVEKR